MSTPSAEETLLVAFPKACHYLNYSNANVLSKAVGEDSTYEYEVRLCEKICLRKELVLFTLYDRP